ncbi:hypothetical protein Ddye_003934 [Dipteronia dyeriana]|uniref:Uncharacterized protein n=1 Tax=Dipteronia dyeriana TaxID=168575 RepID=A0AAD9XTY3_9ROSI|nr:hypothetical protein Ddye_003934 [Dipteronia dyeriana]
MTSKHDRKQSYLVGKTFDICGCNLVVKLNMVYKNQKSGGAIGHMFDYRKPSTPPQINHPQNDDQPQEADQACKEVAESSSLRRKRISLPGLNTSSSEAAVAAMAILLSTQLIKGVCLIQGCVDRHLQEALVMSS